MTCTELPWVAKRRRIVRESFLANGGWIIAHCDGPDGEDNAALIVRVVNSHEAMLDALKRIVGLVELIIPTLEGSQRIGVEDNHRLKAARAAIQLAEPDPKPAPSPPDPTLAPRRRQVVAELRAAGNLDPDEAAIARAMEGRT